MKIIKTAIPDVLILEPTVFGDERGFFYESYNQQFFKEVLGLRDEFVQDNHSLSEKNVLRGLHYQLIQPQAKLIRVTLGEVFDVAIDLRKNSPTFGKWVGVYLSQKNKRQLWIPKGFAHGFLVISSVAECLYKTTDFYHPQSEYCISWDDPDLNILWPVDTPPILSSKDALGKSLKASKVFL